MISCRLSLWVFHLGTQSKHFLSINSISIYIFIHHIHFMKNTFFFFFRRLRNLLQLTLFLITYYWQQQQQQQRCIKKMITRHRIVVQFVLTEWCHRIYITTSSIISIGTVCIVRDICICVCVYALSKRIVYVYTLIKYRNAMPVRSFDSSTENEEHNRLAKSRHQMVN